MISIVHCQLNIPKGVARGHFRKGVLRCIESNSGQDPFRVVQDLELAYKSIKKDNIELQYCNGIVYVTESVPCEMRVFTVSGVLFYSSG